MDRMWGADAGPVCNFSKQHYMTLQIAVKMLFHRSLQTELRRDRQPSPSSLPGQVGQFKLIDLRGLKLTSKLFKIAGCWRVVMLSPVCTQLVVTVILPPQDTPES